MTRERASLDLPDLSDFRPVPAKVEASRPELKKTAEDSGFTTRHAAPAATPPAPAKFDARSLAKTNRTAKLNIAVSEETRLRFWELAQGAGVSNGEDALIAFMNVYESSKL